MTLTEAENYLAKTLGSKSFEELTAGMGYGDKKSYQIQAYDILVYNQNQELSELREEKEYWQKSNNTIQEIVSDQEKQIQSLQEEIQNEQEAHIKTLQQHTGELKKAQKIIMDLSEEMKKKEEQIKVLFGICVEKNCERPAVIDYNGHKHYVCQAHYDSLTRYFEEEYK